MSRNVFCDCFATTAGMVKTTCFRRDTGPSTADCSSDSLQISQRGSRRRRSGSARSCVSTLEHIYADIQYRRLQKLPEHQQYEEAQLIWCEALRAFQANFSFTLRVISIHRTVYKGLAMKVLVEVEMLRRRILFSFFDNLIKNFWPWGPRGEALDECGIDSGRGASYQFIATRNAWIWKSCNH